MAKARNSNLIYCVFLVLCIILLCAMMSSQAYAGQVAVSNVSGSLTVSNVGGETCDNDWSFSFTVANAVPGDYVTVVTQNIPLLAPKDVEAGGTVIGQITAVSTENQHPNSLNIIRTYRITFNSNLSNAHVTLAGFTVNGHSDFIYEGGHWETSYISVNGTTAVSQNVLHPSGAWYHDPESTGAGFISYHSAYYENGTVAPYSLNLSLKSGEDLPLYPGDVVVYHKESSGLKMSLASGYQVGGIYDGSLNHNPGNLPLTFRLISNYGFYEAVGTVYQYKILSCTENELRIEMVRIGDAGVWLNAHCCNITITPQNSSTINFEERRTREDSTVTTILRNGSEIYRSEGAYFEQIQSQEVLSDASFFAQVNTSVVNGTITPSTRADQGANITINYSPNTGYELESIVVDGAALSLTSYPNSYTFYNTQGTHSITVRYKIKTFTISTSVSNGTISPTEVVNWGTNKTVFYSPSSGYLLKSVTVDGSAVNIGSYPNSYTFSNIQANHSVAVVYAKPTASKAVTPDSVTAETSTNDKITYTISYSNPTSIARTVVITDTIPTNTTANSINNGGTQSGNTITWTQTVAANSSGSVSWVARAEYAAANSTVTNTASVVFKKISGSNESDVTLSVSKSNTVIRNPTLTTSCTNGTISAGNNNVHRGSNVTVYYSPNTGYLLYDVKIDGTNIDIETHPDSYTFTNYQDDHTVAVSYAAPSASKSWALTISS